MNPISHFKSKLNKAQSILITAHTSPDGDAVGSALGMWHYLTNKGKQASIVLPNAFPDFLSWMDGSNTILLFDEHTEQAQQLAKNADLIIALDFNEPHRVAGFQQDLENANGFKVLIDHHRGEPNWMDLNLSVIGASSTCQLVFETLLQLEENNLNFLTKRMAECLYSGLMTDTGGFRFSTDSKVHKVAAALLDAGVSPSEIDNKINNSFSMNRLKLFGFCSSTKMQLRFNNQVAFVALSAKELKQFHVQKGDTEGLVNQAMKIASVKVSVLLKEDFNEQDEAQAKIKLSFRSKGSINVADFVKEHFEGGGHLNAAGGVSYLSLEQTVQKLEEKLHLLEL